MSQLSTFTSILIRLNNRLTAYQNLGLQKLVSFKNQFQHPSNSIGNADKKSITYSEQRKKIQEFISLFCEYQLADTNYLENITEVKSFGSVEEWMKESNLDAILKQLTYIIWTDRILEGYFEVNIKDNMIFHLLERIEALIQH